ncbi:MAG: segregation/condensation protein A, partial [Myxococcota bacterium]
MSQAELPPPLDPSFRIALPTFEGPLDLLLHLAQKHELDLLDLPIAFVAEKYLAHIQMMKVLNLEVAGEYLVMSAELARIKSKMMLPPSPYEEPSEEDADEQDPRATLIRRLLEYQKYRHAAEDLGDRPWTGRDVFPRPARPQQVRAEAPLQEISIFKLLEAIQRVLEKQKKGLSLQISAERISIQERMTQITAILHDSGKCNFEYLFDAVGTTYDIVV